MRVALGKKPADLGILNGTLLNTFTAELQPGVAIAISSTRIAAIGDVRRCIGPQTKVVDANGRYLVPGLCEDKRDSLGESSRVSATRMRR
jgi:adenine deaminase